MRTGTTPMSAVEATMISCAYAQMGKYYGFPTHTYAALSDAKELLLEVGPGGDFLTTKHTRKWFKKEQYIPGP